VDKKPQPLRRAHLASYLRELIKDVRDQGKIVEIEGNLVQMAAVAIMSGSVAVVEAMAEDLKVLAGGAKANVKALAQPMLKQVTAVGVGMLMDKFFGGQKR
jgi:hypothetical protein